MKYFVGCFVFLFVRFAHTSSGSSSSYADLALSRGAMIARAATANSLVDLKKQVENGSITDYSETLKRAITCCTWDEMPARQAALDLLGALINKGAITDYKEAIQIASDNCQSSDIKVRMSAIAVFSYLVAKGALTDYREVIRVAGSNCQSDTPQIRWSAMYLFRFLIDKEVLVDYKDAIQAASINCQSTESYERSGAIWLLSSLVEKGALTSYKEAIQAAISNSRHADIDVRSSALWLFFWLVEKGAITDYKEAIQVASNNSQNADLGVSSNAIALWGCLVEKGAITDYKEAIQVAKGSYQSDNEVVRINAFYLLGRLVEKDVAIDWSTIISVPNNSRSIPGANVHYESMIRVALTRLPESLSLLRGLVKKNVIDGYEQIIQEEALSYCNASNPRMRSDAFLLLRSLVDEGKISKDAFISNKTLLSAIFKKGLLTCGEQIVDLISKNYHHSESLVRVAVVDFCVTLVEKDIRVVSDLARRIAFENSKSHDAQELISVFSLLTCLVQKGVITDYESVKKAIDLHRSHLNLDVRNGVVELTMFLSRLKAGGITSSSTPSSSSLHASSEKTLVPSAPDVDLPPSYDFVIGKKS